MTIQLKKKLYAWLLSNLGFLLPLLIMVFFYSYQGKIDFGSRSDVKFLLIATASHGVLLFYVIKLIYFISQDATIHLTIARQQFSTDNYNWRNFRKIKFERSRIHQELAKIIFFDPFGNTFSFSAFYVSESSINSVITQLQSYGYIVEVNQTGD